MGPNLHLNIKFLMIRQKSLLPQGHYVYSGNVYFVRSINSLYKFHILGIPIASSLFPIGNLIIYTLNIKRVLACFAITKTISNSMKYNGSNINESLCFSMRNSIFLAQMCKILLCMENACARYRVYWGNHAVTGISCLFGCLFVQGLLPGFSTKHLCESQPGHPLAMF